MFPNNFSIQKFGVEYEKLKIQEKIVIDDSYPKEVIE
jgi:hypothetical protein